MCPLLYTDDVMYLSTMDETSLLHVFAQLVNGELLEMSEEEWKSQVNYIKVLVELIKNSFKQDEKNFTYVSRKWN